MPYAPLNRETLNLLRAELAPERVLTLSDQLDAYSTDAGTISARPEAVLLAESAEEVAAVLKLANQRRFAVTPRGAATGLAGGVCPNHGGVVLSVERMNRILCLDARNITARVQPGVITQDLRDAAEAQGLFYPPDPASLDSSSVGGNAATNAGGPACLKYGTTRDYILGLQAVLPSGKIIRAGAHTRKNVVGYDMTRLLVGSEGTLGVITELTVKLIPKPPVVRALAALFPDLRTASKGVNAVLTGGHLPSALEFMDHKCLALVAELLPETLRAKLPGPQAAMILLEMDGHPAALGQEMGEVAALCMEAGAVETLDAPGRDERETLWAVRRQISLRIHETAAIYVPEDVVVPISRIPDLVDLLPGIEEQYGVTVYAFGHAGDGNIHLNLTTQRADMEREMDGAVRLALEKVLEMDGTLSGEHGIGLAKIPFVAMELDPESIRLQRAIKRIFDPNNILNPGKLFPEE